MASSRRTQARTEAAGIISDIEFDSEAFYRSLVDHIRRLEVRSEAALWTLGLQVQNTTRLLCPVDTGRLRSSWMLRKGRDTSGPFVEIASNVFYAVYVEFGTRFMAAQPHVRPALAKAAGMIPGAIRAAAGA